MGQLLSADNRPFIVILIGEDIELKGESFDHPETIGILKGRENRLFEQYAKEYPIAQYRTGEIPGGYRILLNFFVVFQASVHSQVRYPLDQGQALLVAQLLELLCQANFFFKKPAVFCTCDQRADG